MGEFSNEVFRESKTMMTCSLQWRARLVTQRGVGESASAVWKAVQERLRSATASLICARSWSSREEVVAGPFDEVVAVDGAAPALVFWERLEKEPPRRRASSIEPGLSTLAVLRSEPEHSQGNPRLPFPAASA